MLENSKFAEIDSATQPRNTLQRASGQEARASKKQVLGNSKEEPRRAGVGTLNEGAGLQS